MIDIYSPVWDEKEYAILSRGKKEKIYDFLTGEKFKTIDSLYKKIVRCEGMLEELGILSFSFEFEELYDMIRNVLVCQAVKSLDEGYNQHYLKLFYEQYIDGMIERTFCLEKRLERLYLLFKENEKLFKYGGNIQTL